MRARPISVPPPAGCDIEQVDEVALVEVAWPEGEEACDLAALHGHLAGFPLDKSPDLVGAAQTVWIDGSYAGDVLGSHRTHLSHAGLPVLIRTLNCPPERVRQGQPAAAWACRGGQPGANCRQGRRRELNHRAPPLARQHAG